MADSKLLKEAIADAKAVRETAIENARIALEEAFTPKLQSLVSKKLQAEMEEEEGDDDDFDYEDDNEEEEVDENVDSSKIGKGDGKSESGTDNKQPSGNSAHTELDPETQKQTAALGAEDSENEKVDDLKEDDDSEVPDPYDAEYETPEEELETGVYEEEEYDDEDELDLESIIRELEAEISEEDDNGEEEDDEIEIDAEPDAIEDPELDIDIEDDDEEEEEIELPEADHDDDYDDEIDLDEILREMGYGDDEDEEEEVAEADDSKYDELEGELEEAYSTIRELKGTINEVNLLNAKLLYTNKLFRSYELDNSQKVKVVESLDRTSNVREVKLVYSTLAESLKFGGKVGKKVKKITEGLASRPSKSTAPKKEIIQEGNEMANRFKKLAGINK